MVSEKVRLKVKLGESEIEIEGTKTEVKELLNEVGSFINEGGLAGLPVDNKPIQEDTVISGQKKQTKKTGGAKPTEKQRTSKKQTPTSKKLDDTIIGIVNFIKGEAVPDSVRTDIFFGKNTGKKIVGLLYYSNSRDEKSKLTSGDIHAALHELRAKPPNKSNVSRQCSGDTGKISQYLQMDIINGDNCYYLSQQGVTYFENIIANIE